MSFGPAERQHMQTQLARLGFYMGSVDGAWGPQTFQAVDGLVGLDNWREVPNLDGPDAVSIVQRSLVNLFDPAWVEGVAMEMADCEDQCE